jgi:hypothetical protein
MESQVLHHLEKAVRGQSRRFTATQDDDPRCATCHSAPGAGFDRVGAATSSLCAVHCAGGALLALAATPFSRAAEVFGNTSVEAGFATAATLIALHSLLRGYRWHRDRGVVWLVAVGLSLLGAARLVDGARALELASSLLGATCLVVGHACSIYRLRQVALATSGDAAWRRKPARASRAQGRPAIAVPVAWLCLFLQGSAFAHTLLVRHTLCLEHGELIHAPSAAADAAPRALESERGRGAEQGSALASEHEHEHCAVFALRRNALAPLAQAQITGALTGFERPCGGHGEGVCSSPSAALLLLAPKTSPPA